MIISVLLACGLLTFAQHSLGQMLPDEAAWRGQVAELTKANFVQGRYEKLTRNWVLFEKQNFLDSAELAIAQSVSLANKLAYQGLCKEDPNCYIRYGCELTQGAPYRPSIVAKCPQIFSDRNDPAALSDKFKRETQNVFLAQAPSPYPNGRIELKKRNWSVRVRQDYKYEVNPEFIYGHGPEKLNDPITYYYIASELIAQYWSTFDWFSAEVSGLYEFQFRKDYLRGNRYPYTLWQEQYPNEGTRPPLSQFIRWMALSFVESQLPESLRTDSEFAIAVELRAQQILNNPKLKEALSKQDQQLTSSFGPPQIIENSARDEAIAEVKQMSPSQRQALWASNAETSKFHREHPLLPFHSSTFEFKTLLDFYDSGKANATHRRSSPESEGPVQKRNGKWVLRFRVIDFPLFAQGPSISTAYALGMAFPVANSGTQPANEILHFVAFCTSAKLEKLIAELPTCESVTLADEERPQVTQALKGSSADLKKTYQLVNELVQNRKGEGLQDQKKQASPRTGARTDVCNINCHRNSTQLSTLSGSQNAYHGANNLAVHLSTDRLTEALNRQFNEIAPYYKEASAAAGYIVGAIVGFYALSAIWSESIVLVETEASKDLAEEMIYDAIVKRQLKSKLVGKWVETGGEVLWRVKKVIPEAELEVFRRSAIQKTIPQMSRMMRTLYYAARGVIALTGSAAAGYAAEKLTDGMLYTDYKKKLVELQDRIKVLDEQMRILAMKSSLSEADADACIEILVELRQITLDYTTVQSNYLRRNSQYKARSIFIVP